MTRLDRQIRKGGVMTALSLLLLLVMILLAYHLVTGFGLSYFYTKKNIGLENFSEGGAYARAVVTEAYSIRRDTEGEYYICPCPDKRSTFILFMPTKYADGFNKKITKGKTIKVKGRLTLLDSNDKSAYLAMAQRIGHGYEPGLIRGCRLDYMRFSDYFNRHIYINTVVAVILAVLLALILRFAILGSYGNLKRSIKKYDYDLDSIKHDFEDARRIGGLAVGNRFVVRLSPLDVIAADDIKKASKDVDIMRVSYKFIPLPFLKMKEVSVVIEALDGKKWSVKFFTEREADKALEALKNFSYIDV